MLSKVDQGGTNKVGGKEAVDFFKSSGLSVDKLKEIWLLSARTSNQFLTRDEFYVALRLIAYAQNGTPATEQSVQLNIETQLPSFNLSQYQPVSAKADIEPALKPEDIANLPSLDELDAEQLSGINSLIPSMDKKMHEQQMTRQSTRHPPGTFVITPAEK